MSTTYDIVGIGNAIVDVIAPGDDMFLDQMGIQKSIMQLVERERAELLYAAMKERTETPGGSVANTLAGAGALGAMTAFVGRVADDPLGKFYAEAMNEGGTNFVNPPVAEASLPTSRSMIFVSPDGERSMNTFLGESTNLTADDVDAAVVGNTRYLFLEGYLFDKDDNKAAFLQAARLCREGGGKPGIALSDPFCVDRHRDDFLRLVADEMDWVIGNEEEWTSLYQVDSFDAAMAKASEVCSLVAGKRSGDGVTVIADGVRTDVAVKRVVPVDATGAGDQFAAGFLFGLATGRDMETAARMGCVAAGEVISHIGPRPETDMIELFKAEGLLCA